MTPEQIVQLIRERNKLRIELTRERIIAERRHKAFSMMWKHDGRNVEAFNEWFWHHFEFDTYMRSVPAFAIDTEPGADHSAHWDHYLLFVESWEKNGPDLTFKDYLEQLNQRYDMLDQD